MGVGGTLEYLSDLMGSGGHKHKKKQLQTVELKVRMDCDGCELKVKKALSSLSGMSTFPCFIFIFCFVITHNWLYIRLIKILGVFLQELNLWRLTESNRR